MRTTEERRRTQLLNWHWWYTAKRFTKVSSNRETRIVASLSAVEANEGYCNTWYQRRFWFFLLPCTRIYSKHHRCYVHVGPFRLLPAVKIQLPSLWSQSCISIAIEDPQIVFRMSINIISILISAANQFCWMVLSFDTFAYRNTKRPYFATCLLCWETGIKEALEECKYSIKSEQRLLQDIIMMLIAEIESTANWKYSCNHPPQTLYVRVTLAQALFMAK